MPELGQRSTARAPMLVGNALRIGWCHPEWWTLALSLGAWATMILSGLSPLPYGLCTAPALEAPRAIHGVMSIGVAALALVEWTPMVVAMMLPLVVIPVRHAAFTSLWQRRHRAIAEVLLGYLAVWSAAGVVASAIAAGIGLDRPDSRLETVFGFAVAALWQLTPVKQRALRACHRRASLAPSGWRASADCVLYGLEQGCSCVVSCWALMLAVLPSHDVAAMLGASAVAVYERYQRPRPPYTVAGLLAAFAIAFLFWPPA